MSSEIQHFCYPRSKTPPEYASEIIAAFCTHQEEICTESLKDGLKSDEVLAQLRSELERAGFDVELEKSQDEEIHRPVLFGENGKPELRYEVDAYHEEWRCGLEVEAGRAWKGNAIYRGLIQVQ